MAKKAKKALVPKLRFPEFRGREGWGNTNLDDLCELITKGSTPTSYGYEYVGSGVRFVKIESLENGLVNISRTAYITNECHEAFFRSQLKNNDILFSIAGALGLVAHVRNEDLPANVNQALAIVRLKNGQFCQFLLHYLCSSLIQAEVLRIRAGAAQPNISLSQLGGFKVLLPTPIEQKKIADCLSSLDELIAAQGRKVEALKTYKRGLMQQLFPREGETLPRLRFPEFRHASEWEPTTLDALVHLQSGGTPSKANPEFWNGAIPWVSAKDMKRLFLHDAEDHISASAVKDGAKVVPVGTVLILVRGMTLLKDVPICVLRREMSFNQDVKALLPKGETDGLFVALLLLGNKQRLLRMVDIAGHGTGKLNTDELNALELSAPKPAEQQRIADFLSSFDAQIATEADKLAALKTHKNGLMQQLFPSPEGA